MPLSPYPPGEHLAVYLEALRLFRHILPVESVLCHLHKLPLLEGSSSTVQRRRPPPCGPPAGWCPWSRCTSCHSSALRLYIRTAAPYSPSAGGFPPGVPGGADEQGPQWPCRPAPGGSTTRLSNGGRPCPDSQTPSPPATGEPVVLSRQGGVCLLAEKCFCKSVHVPCSSPKIYAHSTIVQREKKWLNPSKKGRSHLFIPDRLLSSWQSPGRTPPNRWGSSR